MRRSVAGTICGLVGFLLAVAGGVPAIAGGPKYVAGTTYFNPAVVGQPVIWAGGRVSYRVDQGPLSAQVTNQQARAMVDAAAAAWNGVGTAAVQLTDAGALAEDVNGADVEAENGIFEAPADVTPNATGTQIGVIFDADGSVINALYGQGASQPDNCATNGVFFWLDNVQPNATFAHGVMVVNGLCATSAALLQMMSFQMERGFGRLLGLDYAQINPNALTQASAEPGGQLGWPVMQPGMGLCGASGGACLPGGLGLRYDDVAALSRLYPVTAANQSGWPGKSVTAQATVSIRGTVQFRNGVGMQGVNVVARPLDASGNPMWQYAVSFVSGGYFNGNHGNPVTGMVDGGGNPLTNWGGNACAMQGYFDLSAVPLPPGMTMASYQVSFEPVNPAWMGQNAVGPYGLGSPAPSGTLAAVTVPWMAAGSSQSLTVTAAGSATTASTACAAGGVRRTNLMPATGSWTGRLGAVGQTDWYVLPVRGNRIFTIVTQALDETGNPSAVKAMPAIGVWDGFDLVGSAAVGFAGANNGNAVGETWLQVATAGNDVVRLAVADQRGDGRPDYVYRGWVLYADQVLPARVPVTGGQITIRGFGFRAGDTVTVGGVAATVVGILPNQITAIAPAGLAGSADVLVNDQPLFNAMAMIPGGLSYDAGTGDALGIVSSPMGQVPMGVPQSFTVLALGTNGKPAGGVLVSYSVTMGSAQLGCGQTTCTAITGGDGRATVMVTATNGSLAAVRAGLANGASIQCQFAGTAAPQISQLTPTLYVAAGATVSWPVQALVLSNGSPVAGQSVTWQAVTGMTAATGTTNSAGVATGTVTVGPLAGGQSVATKVCLTGSQVCAAVNVFGARPEYATLMAIAGTQQTLPVGQTASAVVMRVVDMNGNPMAGGTVTVAQALWAWVPPCQPHGRCAQPQLLQKQLATYTAGLDGTVTITPLGLANTATMLQGLAATGNAGSLSFTVETHP